MARDAWLLPFHENDPWKRPLGSTATYAAISEPNWAAVRDGGISDPNNYAGIKLGMVVSDASHPLRNIWRYNGTSWVVYAQIRVPNTLEWIARRTSGTPNYPITKAAHDNPVMVAAADKETYTEMRNCLRYSARSSGINGETFVVVTDATIAGADPYDICLVPKNYANIPYRAGMSLKGNGWRSIDSNVGAGTTGAAKSLKIGGSLRIGQLNTSLGIQEALALFMVNNVLNKSTVPGGKQFAWPADGIDAGGGGSYVGTGNVYMGSLLALPTSSNLATFAAAESALGIRTTQGWALARGFQDYGGYIVETGSFSIWADYEVMKQDLGGYGSQTWTDFLYDIGRIMLQLQVVTNSHDGGLAPTGNIPPSSGGTLRRSLLESFDAAPVPAVPATFALGSPTSNSLTATWDASGVVGETGFDIQHRTVPGSYPGSPQITTIATDATSHVISGLSAGDYAAQGRSKNDSGQSAWSDEATGTVPAPPSVPAAASGVTGTALDYRTIDWSWTDNSDNEDEFKIQVSKDGAAYAQVATVGAGVTTYRYVDSTPGTGLNDYTAKVVASNATGDGAASAASDVVTTPNPPDLGPGAGPGTPTSAIYPASPLFPDAASTVFPRTEDVKFPA